MPDFIDGELDLSPEICERFMTRFFFPLLMVLAVLPCASGQVLPVLSWVTNSSLKLQQLIGDQGMTNGVATYGTDTDRQTGSNLLNQTYGLYSVGGTDLGNSFEI